MPRSARLHLIFFLGFAALALWALALPGTAVFGDRLLVIAANAASAATTGCSLLYVRRMHDKMAAREQDLAQAQHAALVRTVDELIRMVDRLTSGPGATAGETAEALRTLRAVS